jgi:hypothetical protein
LIRPSKNNKPEIDLRGSQGNAFYIMGTGKDLHKQLTRVGIELPSWAEIQKDMMSSDYDHLCKVFDKYFGDHVDLVY